MGERLYPNLLKVINSFLFTIKSWDRKEGNCKRKANYAIYCRENILSALATGTQKSPPEALEAVTENIFPLIEKQPGS